MSHIKGHKSSKNNADDVLASQDSLEGEEISVSINYDNSTNKGRFMPKLNREFLRLRDISNSTKGILRKNT